MTGKVGVTPGRWIGMGWRIFREDVGNFILITLIGLALSFVSSFVVAGPILGGFFLAVRRRMLEQRTDLNDLFEGFVFVFSLRAERDLFVNALTDDAVLCQPSFTHGVPVFNRHTSR